MARVAALADIVKRWLPGAAPAAAEPDRRVGLGTAPTFETLFDPAFLAALDPFALRIADAQKGGRLAEQRTSARGRGGDFADFKPYVAGDDLRTMDWNSYRRLGKLFVRVFEERQDLPVYLLVDRSRSMFVERPPRIGAALRAVLAIAAVSLRQHDSVTLLPFSDEVAVDLKGVKGRAGIVRVARALATFGAGGGTGLAAAVNTVSAMRMRRGLLVVASDFFDDTGIAAVIDALGRTPHRLLLVQLTRAEDADPRLNGELHGDVVLDDAESFDGVPVSINYDMIDRYMKAYRAFNRSLLDFASGSRVGLIQLDADRDVLSQLDAVFAAGRTIL